MTDPITQAREVYNGFFGDPEERNAGIVLATNLLRTLTSKGAEGMVGEVILPALWSPASGPVVWTDEKRAAAREQADLIAHAVISHLLAAALQKGADHG